MFHSHEKDTNPMFGVQALAPDSKSSLNSEPTPNNLFIIVA